MATIKLSTSDGKVYFSVIGTGSINVNGEPRELLPKNGNVFYYDNRNGGYGAGAPKTITITGNNITVFVCNHYATELEISKDSVLESLDCGSNRLKILDVSGLTKLKNLNCFNNQLENLNLSSCVSLEKLNCSINQLTSLNLSNLDLILNPRKEDFSKFIREGGLGERLQVYERESLIDLIRPDWPNVFNVSSKLHTIECSINKFRTLKLSSVSLKEIYFGNDLLTSVDLKGCVKLENVYYGAYPNQILNLSGHTQIKKVDCTGKLDKLDVSNCTSLEEITLYDDGNARVDRMNVTGCTSLKEIYYRPIIMR